jgi:Zn-dependent protease with chaperone function
MSTVSLRARSVASLIVLILFPFFVLFLVIAILAAGGWLATKSSSAGSHVIVLVIPLLLAVGAAVRSVIRARKPRPLPGHELTRAEHPALWSELDAMATAMDQPTPDRVVVLPMVNAFVTTASGHREVMIGYPLLAGLSRGQLRSVLAHEMGHLAHGHTRSGGLAYRASGLLKETVARLDSGFTRQLVVGYYRFYLLISMSVLRDHERQADDWSARLAGGPEAAAVFPALARLDATWDLLVDAYLPLAGQTGARPDLREGLHQLSAGRKAKLDEVVARQLARVPSRWDTHPGDAERIRRLEAEPALAGAREHTEAAWELLGRQQPGPTLDSGLAAAALQEIEAGLLSTSGATVSWQQVVEDATLQNARSQVDFVVDQLQAQQPEIPSTLRGLLAALAGPSGRALVAPLLRGDLAPERREAAITGTILGTTHSAILLALAEPGRARMALRWDGPAELEFRTPAGEVTPWPDELEPTAPLDPAQVTRILDRLTADGIDPDRPLPIEAPAVAAPAGAPAATGENPAHLTGPKAETPARSRTLRSITNGAVIAVKVKPRQPGGTGRTLHDVIVMDDGLLLNRIPGRPYGFWAALQVQYLPGPLVRKGQARVQTLAEEVAGDPITWAAAPEHQALWLPYPSITQARLQKGRGRRRLTLTQADGSILKLHWTAYSFELGQLDQVLQSALHGRLS